MGLNLVAPGRWRCFDFDAVVNVASSEPRFSSEAVTLVSLPSELAPLNGFEALLLVRPP